MAEGLLGGSLEDEVEKSEPVENAAAAAAAPVAAAVAVNVSRRAFASRPARRRQGGPRVIARRWRRCHPPLSKVPDVSATASESTMHG
jgi:hypothetical protein